MFDAVNSREETWLFFFTAGVELVFPEILSGIFWPRAGPAPSSPGPFLSPDCCYAVNWGAPTLGPQKRCFQPATSGFFTNFGLRR